MTIDHTFTPVYERIWNPFGKKLDFHEKNNMVQKQKIMCSTIVRQHERICLKLQFDKSDVY